MNLLEDIEFDFTNEDIVSLFDLSQDSIECDNAPYFDSQNIEFQKFSDLFNLEYHAFEKNANVSSISDQDLIETPIKNLNNILKTKSDHETKEIKKKRRKLKNRLYARESRNRKQIQKTLYENESTNLLLEIKKLQTKIDKLKRERDYYKDQCHHLQLAANRNEMILLTE